MWSHRSASSRNARPGCGPRGWRCEWCRRAARARTSCTDLWNGPCGCAHGGVRAPPRRGRRVTCDRRRRDRGRHAPLQRTRPGCPHRCHRCHPGSGRARHDAGDGSWSRCRHPRLTAWHLGRGARVADLGLRRVGLADLRTRRRGQPGLVLRVGGDIVARQAPVGRLVVIAALGVAPPATASAGGCAGLVAVAAAARPASTPLRAAPRLRRRALREYRPGWRPQSIGRHRPASVLWSCRLRRGRSQARGPSGPPALCRRTSIPSLMTRARREAHVRLTR